jgi:hypothetical protein
LLFLTFLSYQRAQHVYIVNCGIIAEMEEQDQISIELLTGPAWTYFSTGKTVEQCFQQLKEDGFPVSRRTFMRYLKQWREDPDFPPDKRSSQVRILQRLALVP